MTISRDGTRLYISDTTRGVIAIDRQGRELWQRPVNKLERVTGICVDVNDNVIASGFGSCSIIQISSHGETTFDLLVADNASAVCYDVPNRRMLVSLDSRSSLRVYDVCWRA